MFHNKTLLVKDMMARQAQIKWLRKVDSKKAKVLLGLSNES